MRPEVVPLFKKLGAPPLSPSGCFLRPSAMAASAALRVLRSVVLFRDGAGHAFLSNDQPSLCYEGTGAKNDTPRTFSSIRSAPPSDGTARAVQSARSHSRQVMPIGTAAAALSMSSPSE